MATIISSSAPQLGASEKSYYAQQIIDAFSKAIDGNMCLSKVPIALYSQLNTYEQTLGDVFTSLGQTVPSNLAPDNSFSYIPATDSTVLISTIVNPDSNILNQFTSSIVTSLNNDCIPCGLELPNFDLGSIYNNLLDQIDNFLSILDNLFNTNIPKYCHFSYFLSFLCIPDLAKILALIIARIIQLSASISIGSLSVSAFISGIIGTILQTIMQVILSLLNFAASPINCLLASLNSLLSKLPTEANIRQDLGQNVPGTGQQEVAYYTSLLNAQYAGTTALIKNEFAQAEVLITDAASGVQNTIAQLLSLINFNTCENERVTGVFLDVERIVELIQLANILSAVLQLKTKNAVLNQLCKYDNSTIDTSSTNPLASDDIASIIDTITGGITDIIQDGNGNTVGIIVNPGIPSDNNLSLFSCNLATFMANNTLPSIISQVTPVAVAALKGNGNSPQANVGPIRNIVNLNTVLNNPNAGVVLFNTGSQTTSIIDQINSVFGYNPFQDKSELNYYSLVDPKTIQEKIINNTTNAGNVASKQFIIDNQIQIINGPGNSKPAQIKCGNIENIKSNISLILGNI